MQTSIPLLVIRAKIIVMTVGWWDDDRTERRSKPPVYFLGRSVAKRKGELPKKVGKKGPSTCRCGVARCGGCGILQHAASRWTEPNDFRDAVASRVWRLSRRVVFGPRENSTRQIGQRKRATIPRGCGVEVVGGGSGRLAQFCPLAPNFASLCAQFCRRGH